MTLEGIDTINHIPASVLKLNGKRFVCRYLPIPGKTNPNFTTDANEIAALLASDIFVVLNHETTGKTYRGGYNAGITDATDAQAACHALGYPDAPCIFTVDEDTTDYATINQWLDGCSSVIGRNRTGLYHKYESIKSALEGGHTRYGWQTYAWSGGQIYDQCHIYQYSNDQSISGFSCDLNRTVVSDSDFGQLGVTAPPSITQEDLLTMRTVTTPSMGGPYDDTFVLQPNSTKVIMKRTDPLKGSLNPGHTWSSPLPGDWIDCVKAYIYNDASHGQTEVFVGVGTDGNLWGVYWGETPSQSNWAGPLKLA